MSEQKCSYASSIRHPRACWGEVKFNITPYSTSIYSCQGHWRCASGGPYISPNEGALHDLELAEARQKAHAKIDRRPGWYWVKLDPLFFGKVRGPLIARWDVEEDGTKGWSFVGEPETWQLEEDDHRRVIVLKGPLHL